MRLFMTLLLAASAAPLVAAQEQHTKPGFTIYTHGEAATSFIGPDGVMRGAAVDFAACAGETIGITFDWQTLPLTRANAVMRSDKPALWTPATRNNSARNGIEFIGPVDRVNVLWYMHKDDKRDPESADFKKLAVVSAYRGSLLVDVLKNRSYNVVAASTQHRHLLERLFYGRVDAILAVDFRHLLSNATLTRFNNDIRTKLFRQFDIGFSASQGFSEKKPKMVAQFRSAVLRCVKDAKGS